MTPRDRHDSDLGVERQGSRLHRVVRDTTTGPGDRDDEPSPKADESNYAGAPARSAAQPLDPVTTCDAGRPTSEIDLEDGQLVVTVDPVLTDAAADVLWRVIEKAMRRGGSG